MLIRAAVRMGAIAAGAHDRQLDDLTSYAEDVGLAFQIADDVLNVTGTREELGKNPNTDAERGKKTYPTFYGAEGAKQLADDCVARAVARLPRSVRPPTRSANWHATSPPEELTSVIAYVVKAQTSEPDSLAIGYTLFTLRSPS